MDGSTLSDQIMGLIVALVLVGVIVGFALTDRRSKNKSDDGGDILLLGGDDEDL
jgi:hypothetical protein